MYNDGEATSYQAFVARANYFAARRPDKMYATKEVCRGIAQPALEYWHMLKRLGMHLVGNGQADVRDVWQGHRILGSRLGR